MTSPALLTKELESAMAKLRTPNSVSVLTPTHIFTPSEAAALLARIAALEQRAEELERIMAVVRQARTSGWYEEDPRWEPVDAFVLAQPEAALPKEPR